MTDTLDARMPRSEGAVVGRGRRAIEAARAAGVVQPDEGGGATSTGRPEARDDMSEAIARVEEIARGGLGYVDAPGTVTVRPSSPEQSDAETIEEALGLIHRHGGMSTYGEKQWLLDRVVRLLLAKRGAEPADYPPPFGDRVCRDGRRSEYIRSYATVALASQQKSLACGKPSG